MGLRFLNFFGSNFQTHECKLFWVEKPRDGEEMRIYNSPLVPGAEIRQILSNGYILAQDVIEPISNLKTNSIALSDYISSANFYKSLILIDENLNLADSILNFHNSQRTSNSHVYSTGSVPNDILIDYFENS